MGSYDRLYFFATVYGFPFNKFQQHASFCSEWWVSVGVGGG